MNDSVKSLPFYIKERVARDPSSSEDELCELATDNDFQIRVTVAKNTGSSSNVLACFIDEEDKHVISVLSRRAELPVEVLRNISLFLLSEIDELIAKNANDYDLVLSSYICSNVIAHPKTEREILESAAHHKLNLIRLGALCNPNLPAELLEEMILNEMSSSILQEMLTHPHAEKVITVILEGMGIECRDLPLSYLKQLISMSVNALEE